MRYFIQGMFTQGEDKRKGVGVEICILRVLKFWPVLGTTFAPVKLLQEVVRLSRK